MRATATFILCQEDFTDRSDCLNNANPNGVSRYVPDAGGYLCQNHYLAWMYRYCDKLGKCTGCEECEVEEMEVWN